MCLIIHKPVNAVVSAEVIIDAYDYNRDGWGLMYAIAGKIEVIKGLNIIDLLEALDTLTKYEVFIHLRYRTHGTISYENLHPFQISKNIWLMHNGILSQLPTDKTKSDTALFAQMLMPMLVHNPDLLDDVGFCSLLSYYCKGSRLVFLRSNGQYTIINKQDGINWCGLWMSNTYAWTLHTDTPKIKASKKVAVSVANTSFKAEYKTIEPKLWQGDDYLPDWQYTDLNSDESSSLHDLSLDELRKLSYDDLYNLTWEDPDTLIYAIMYG